MSTDVIDIPTIGVKATLHFDPKQATHLSLSETIPLEWRAGGCVFVPHSIIQYNSMHRSSGQVDNTP